MAKPKAEKTTPGKFKLSKGQMAFKQSDSGKDWIPTKLPDDIAYLAVDTGNEVFIHGFKCRVFAYKFESVDKNGDKIIVTQQWAQKTNPELPPPPPKKEDEEEEPEEELESQSVEDSELDQGSTRSTSPEITFEDEEEVEPEALPEPEEEPEEQTPPPAPQKQKKAPEKPVKAPKESAPEPEPEPEEPRTQQASVLRRIAARVSSRF